MKYLSPFMILQRATFYLLLFLVVDFFGLGVKKSFAEIRDFQTTRMKSTAGAGVGALLFEDATFLNPAPLAFYNNSAIYFQKINTEQKQEYSNNTEINEASTTAAILTDADAAFKGAFSYVKQSVNQERREQFGFAFANTIQDKSSLGSAFLIKKDLVMENGQLKRRDFTQVNFGVTHIISETINLGVSILDAFRSQPGKTKVMIGSQLVYRKYISIMLDIGSDYKNDLEQNYVWRAASQVKFLDDFYLKFGLFRDESMNEKGNGIGLSWVSPRMSIDVASNNIQKTDNDVNIVSDKISEFTFSLSLLF